MVDWTGLADRAVELPIVTSFSRIGFDVRSRLAGWSSIDSYDLSGRTVIVTGATSGLGRCMAETLARCGASVVLWGRSGGKTQQVREELERSTGRQLPDPVVADMSEPEEIRRGAAEFLLRHDRLDVLVHNAGALSPTRVVNSVGRESTVPGQVLGPFLLTSLMLDRLRQSATSRVITMSSGGMYASPLRVEDLEMGDDYRGAEQYARAKRAQVTLNELWAQHHPGSGVVFHAVHPGWADTPGIQESLPAFRRVMRPLLRTVEQGADTALWLAADDGEPLASSGGFWHDRVRRSIHKLPTTRRSDTPERRQALWEWCSSQITS
jgi:NAD(P)-dependent dehydrogenase (short-subunit alcohol dehydrogenase family)